MDAYLVVKFFHICLSVAWLGGGLAVILLGTLAERSRDRDELMQVIRHTVRLAPIVFIPGSVLVLVTGLAMVWLGGLAWEAWVVIGLAGVAVTGGVGMAVLGPLSERIAALAAAPGGEAEAVSLARRLLRFARVDYLIQFTIVFAMVAKPQWSDHALLLGMAAVVALAAALFVARAPRAGLA